MTAASELTRNMLLYANGGYVTVEHTSLLAKKGVRVTFKDHGPGIADIEKAMEDGYSTSHGLGLGLSGAKRLVGEFEITSSPSMGTCVAITVWKS